MTTGSTIRSRVSGNSGWGINDRPYDHQNPHSNGTAPEGGISSDPTEALRLASRLLTQEGAHRNISLDALSRFFSDTVASYQSDSSYSQRREHSQQNLALIAQILRSIPPHSVHAAQAQEMLNELERVQGFLELESTLRSGTSVLGSDWFERCGVFVNMGASVAGRLGSLGGLFLGMRAPLGISLVSGLANAFFQSGLQLTHAYAEGQDSTKLQIVGELGEAAVGAIGCGLVSYGLGHIRGASRWWSIAMFVADVGVEYLLGKASIVKHLLGLEVEHFPKTLEVLAYGLIANALGEFLGDHAGELTHHLNHHFDYATQQILTARVENEYGALFSELKQIPSSLVGEEGINLSSSYRTSEVQQWCVDESLLKSYLIQFTEQGGRKEQIQNYLNENTRAEITQALRTLEIENTDPLASQIGTHLLINAMVNKGSISAITQEIVRADILPPSSVKSNVNDNPIGLQLKGGSIPAPTVLNLVSRYSKEDRKVFIKDYQSRFKTVQKATEKVLAQPKNQNSILTAEIQSQENLHNVVQLTSHVSRNNLSRAAQKKIERQIAKQILENNIPANDDVSVSVANDNDVPEEAQRQAIGDWVRIVDGVSKHTPNSPLLTLVSPTSSPIQRFTAQHSESENDKIIGYQSEHDEGRQEQQSRGDESTNENQKALDPVFSFLPLVGLTNGLDHFLDTSKSLLHQASHFFDNAFSFVSYLDSWQPSRLTASLILSLGLALTAWLMNTKSCQYSILALAMGAIESGSGGQKPNNKIWSELENLLHECSTKRGREKQQAELYLMGVIKRLIQDELKLSYHPDQKEDIFQIVHASIIETVLEASGNEFRELALHKINEALKDFRRQENHSHYAARNDAPIGDGETTRLDLTRSDEPNPEEAITEAEENEPRQTTLLEFRTQTRTEENDPVRKAALAFLYSGAEDFKGLAAFARQAGFALGKLMAAIADIVRQDSRFAKVLGISRIAHNAGKDTFDLNDAKVETIASKWTLPTLEELPKPFDHFENYQNALLERAQILKENFATNPESPESKALHEVQARLKRDWSEWFSERSPKNSKKEHPISENISTLIENFLPYYACYALAHFGSKTPRHLVYAEWLFEAALKDYKAERASKESISLDKLRGIFIHFLSAQPGRRGEYWREEAWPSSRMTDDQRRELIAQNYYKQFYKQVEHEITRRRIPPQERNFILKRTLRLFEVYVSELCDRNRSDSSTSQISSFQKLPFNTEVYQRVLNFDFGIPYSPLVQEMFLSFFTSDLITQRLSFENLIREEGQDIKALQWEILVAPLRFEKRFTQTAKLWKSILLQALGDLTITAAQLFIDKLCMDISSNSVFQSWGKSTPNDWLLFASVLTFVEAQADQEELNFQKLKKIKRVDPLLALSAVDSNFSLDTINTSAPSPYEIRKDSNGNTLVLVPLPRNLKGKQDFSFGAFLRTYLSETNRSFRDLSDTDWLELQTILNYANGDLFRMEKDNLEKLVNILAVNDEQKANLRAYLYFALHYRSFFFGNCEVYAPDGHLLNVLATPSKVKVVLVNCDDVLKTIPYGRPDFSEEPIASVMNGKFSELLQFSTSHLQAYRLAGTQRVRLKISKISGLRKYLSLLLYEEDGKIPSGTTQIEVSLEELQDLMSKLSAQHAEHYFNLQAWAEKGRVDTQELKRLSAFYQKTSLLLDDLLFHQIPHYEFKVGEETINCHLLCPTLKHSHGALIHRASDSQQLEAHVIVADLLEYAEQCEQQKMPLSAVQLQALLNLRLLKALYRFQQMSLADNSEVLASYLSLWGVFSEDQLKLIKLHLQIEEESSQTSWVLDPFLKPILHQLSEAGKTPKAAHSAPKGWVDFTTKNSEPLKPSLENIADQVFAAYLRSWWQQTDERFIGNLKWDASLAQEILDKLLQNETLSSFENEKAKIIVLVEELIQSFSARVPDSSPTKSYEPELIFLNQAFAKLYKALPQSHALAAEVVNSCLLLLYQKGLLQTEKAPEAEVLIATLEEVQKNFGHLGLSNQTQAISEDALLELSVFVDLCHAHLKNLAQLTSRVPTIMKNLSVRGNYYDVGDAMSELFAQQAQRQLLEDHPSSLIETIKAWIEKNAQKVGAYDVLQQDVQAYLLNSYFSKLLSHFSSRFQFLKELVEQATQQFHLAPQTFTAEKICNGIILEMEKRLGDIPEEFLEEDAVTSITRELSRYESLGLILEEFQTPLLKQLQNCFAEIDLLKAQAEALRKQEEALQRQREEKELKRQREKELEAIKAAEDLKLAQTSREVEAPPPPKPKPTATVVHAPLTLEELKGLPLTEKAKKEEVLEFEWLNKNQIPEQVLKYLNTYVPIHLARSFIKKISNPEAGHLVRFIAQLQFLYELLQSKSEKSSADEVLLSQIEDLFLELENISSGTLDEMTLFSYNRYDAFQSDICKLIAIWERISLIEFLGNKSDLMNPQTGFEAIDHYLREKELSLALLKIYNPLLKIENESERRCAIAEFFWKHRKEISQLSAKKAVRVETPVVNPSPTQSKIQSKVKNRSELPAELRKQVEGTYPEFAMLTEEEIGFPLNAEEYILKSLQAFIKLMLEDISQIEKQKALSSKLNSFKSSLKTMSRAIAREQSSKLLDLYSECRQDIGDFLIHDSSSSLTTRWILSNSHLAALTRPLILLQGTPAKMQMAMRILNALLDGLAGPEHQEATHKDIYNFFVNHYQTGQGEIFNDQLVDKYLAFYWDHPSLRFDQKIHPSFELKQDAWKIIPELNAISVNELLQERSLFLSGLDSNALEAWDEIFDVLGDSLLRFLWVCKRVGLSPSTQKDFVKLFSFVRLLYNLGIKSHSAKLCWENFAIQLYNTQRPKINFVTFAAQLPELTGLPWRAKINNLIADFGSAQAREKLAEHSGDSEDLNALLVYLRFRWEILSASLISEGLEISSALENKYPEFSVFIRAWEIYRDTIRLNLKDSTFWKSYEINHLKIVLEKTLILLKQPTQQSVKIASSHLESKIKALLAKINKKPPTTHSEISAIFKEYDSFRKDLELALFNRNYCHPNSYKLIPEHTTPTFLKRCLFAGGQHQETLLQMMDKFQLDLEDHVFELPSEMARALSNYYFSNNNEIDVLITQRDKEDHKPKSYLQDIPVWKRLGMLYTLRQGGPRITDEIEVCIRMWQIIREREIPSHIFSDEILATPHNFESSKKVAEIYWKHRKEISLLPARKYPLAPADTLSEDLLQNPQIAALPRARGPIKKSRNQEMALRVANALLKGLAGTSLQEKTQKDIIDFFQRHSSEVGIDLSALCAKGITPAILEVCKKYPNIHFDQAQIKPNQKDKPKFPELEAFTLAELKQARLDCIYEGSTEDTKEWNYRFDAFGNLFLKAQAVIERANLAPHLSTPFIKNITGFISWLSFLSSQGLEENLARELWEKYFFSEYSKIRPHINLTLLTTTFPELREPLEAESIGKIQPGIAGKMSELIFNFGTYFAYEEGKFESRNTYFRYRTALLAAREVQRAATQGSNKNFYFTEIEERYPEFQYICSSIQTHYLKYVANTSSKDFWRNHEIYHLYYFLISLKSLFSQAEEKMKNTISEPLAKKALLTIQDLAVHVENLIESMRANTLNISKMDFFPRYEELRSNILTFLLCTQGPWKEACSTTPIDTIDIIFHHLVKLGGIHAAKAVSILNSYGFESPIDPEAPDPEMENYALPIARELSQYYFEVVEKNEAIIPGLGGTGTAQISTWESRLTEPYDSEARMLERMTGPRFATISSGDDNKGGGLARKPNTSPLAKKVNLFLEFVQTLSERSREIIEDDFKRFGFAKALTLFIENPSYFLEDRILAMHFLAKIQGNKNLIFKSHAGPNSKSPLKDTALEIIADESLSRRTRKNSTSRPTRLADLNTKLLTGSGPTNTEPLVRNEAAPIPPAPVLSSPVVTPVPLKAKPNIDQLMEIVRNPFNIPKSRVDALKLLAEQIEVNSRIAEFIKDYTNSSCEELANAAAEILRKYFSQTKNQAITTPVAKRPQSDEYTPKAQVELTPAYIAQIMNEAIRQLAIEDALLDSLHLRELNRIQNFAEAQRDSTLLRQVKTLIAKDYWRRRKKINL